MISYKDMTFCPFFEKCYRGDSCSRALTPLVQNSAEQWWGNPNYPICIFTTEPDCYEEELKMKLLDKVAVTGESDGLTFKNDIGYLLEIETKIGTEGWVRVSFNKFKQGMYTYKDYRNCWAVDSKTVTIIKREV